MRWRSGLQILDLTVIFECPSGLTCFTVLKHAIESVMTAFAASLADLRSASRVAAISAMFTEVGAHPIRRGSAAPYVRTSIGAALYGSLIALGCVSTTAYPMRLKFFVILP